MVTTVNNSTHKTNIQDLQNDVIGCIEEIIELMGQAKGILSSDRLGHDYVQKYNEYPENIINSLLSALNTSQNALSDITDDIKVRSSAIAHDVKQLEKQIDELESCLANLKSVQKKVVEVHEIRFKTKDKLNGFFKEVKEKSIVCIEDYLNDKNFLNKLGLTRTFLSNSREKIEFISKKRADNFANEASCFAKNKTETLLADTENYVNQEMDKCVQEIIVFFFLKKKPNQLSIKHNSYLI